MPIPRVKPGFTWLIIYIYIWFLPFQVANKTKRSQCNMDPVTEALQEESEAASREPMGRRGQAGQGPVQPGQPGSWQNDIRILDFG